MSGTSSNRSSVGKLIVLMVSAFMDMVGLLMIIPLLPYYATRMGASGLMVGLLVSSFMKTQVAALFGTAVLTVIPVIQFSGFFTPTSSLSGGARIMGMAFPSTYFMQISLGAFTKALGFEALAPHFWPLAAIVVGYLVLSLALLKTQER